jgi:hypothetical protein
MAMLNNQMVLGGYGLMGDHQMGWSSEILLNMTQLLYWVYNLQENLKVMFNIPKTGQLSTSDSFLFPFNFTNFVRD